MTMNYQLHLNQAIPFSRFADTEDELGQSSLTGRRLGDLNLFKLFAQAGAVTVSALFWYFAISLLF